MVQILFHKSNGIQSVLLFKILNDVAVCILLDLRYLIDHEMETLHFISNGEDPCLIDIRVLLIIQVI